MKKRPVQVQGGDGNNKHPPRVSSSKVWCFTINNYNNSNLQWLASLYPEDTKEMVYQKEIGEKGTPHIQGVIKFNQPCRPVEKYPKGIHWEKCRNIKASFLYCQKEDSREPGTQPYIYPKPYKINITLYNWEKDIIQIIKQEPDDRTIYWYWSREGCVGKTTFCKYLTIEHEAICLHGKGSDIRNGVLDYYNKKSVCPILCVFPIPRSYNEEYLSYEGLENIKDMYFYSGKYEGGMICGPCPHLFVFANCEPNLEMCSKDRWKVVCID